jgi:hypothetical protein
MMARKLSALFVLAAFSIFNLSCVPFSTGRASATRTPVDPENLGPEASDLRIVGVSLKTGASFSFDKKLPARLTSDRAAVTGMTYQSLEIPDDDLMNLRRNEKAEIVEIETKSGLLYKISGTTVSEARTLYSAYGPITIPLSDIQQLWIKKSGGGGTSAFTYIAAAGLALGVILLVISTSKQQPDPTPPDESCPFVYSWDGGEYVRDAEPYGAAVSEGLKRTDWIELSSLRPAAAPLILLTNELDGPVHGRAEARGHRPRPGRQGRGGTRRPYPHILQAPGPGEGRGSDGQGHHALYPGKRPRLLAQSPRGPGPGCDGRLQGRAHA